MSNQENKSKLNKLQEELNSVKPLTEEDERSIKGGSANTSGICPAGEHWNTKEQKCVANESGLGLQV